MNIAVLGTGSVGRAIAGRLHELGHSVVVGTRDPRATSARTEPDAMGTAPFATWHADHADVGLATYADAAAGAELVVNATNGAAALEVLGLAGAAHLAGKPLVDISNPLDFSHGFPPTLFVKDTDSLGEQLQRTFPEARVVKTLNTMNADLMVRPADARRQQHRLRLRRRRRREGDRHRAADLVRPRRRHRPRRHRDRPRHRDGPAGVAAPDGGAGHRALQPQGRALTEREVVHDEEASLTAQMVVVPETSLPTTSSGWPRRAVLAGDEVHSLGAEVAGGAGLRAAGARHGWRRNPPLGLRPGRSRRTPRAHSPARGRRRRRCAHRACRGRRPRAPAPCCRCGCRPTASRRCSR